MIQPPAVQGVGSYGGFQFMLQDTGVNTLTDMDRVAHQIVGAGRARKDLTGLITTFSANDPQVLVTIDREKAKAMNIPLSQITTTLGFLWVRSTSTISISTIGRIAFSHRPTRLIACQSGICTIFMFARTRAKWFHWIISRRVDESAGPPVITHYNLFRAVEIDGSPAPGVSSSEGIAGNGGPCEEGHDSGNALRVDGPDAG